MPHLHERLGREIGFFHGGLAARQRDELVASFSQPDGPSVLVISIRAGGRGLNLPAANHVFHFDRWWNPAVEQQATDRAYRFGQHKDVFVHSLICTATLEERIDELLDSKRELAEKVVAGRADDWLGELDLDAIRAAVSLSDNSRRGGGMTLLNEGRPIFVGGDDDRIGRGPWARWLATSVVPDEGSPRAERGRILARTGHVHSVGIVPGEITALVIGSSGAEYRVSLAAEPVRPASGRP